MIISGPTLSKAMQGTISHSKAFVKDLAPTILAIAGTQHPGAIYKGKSIEPITGKNLLPVITGAVDTVYTASDIIAYEIGGNAALIKGDYKIILNRSADNDDDNDGQWHLYNIAQDPGETNALEASQTQVFADLLSEYERYASENGVIAVPKDYHQTEQAGRNGMKKQLGYIAEDNRGKIIAILLFIVAIIVIRRRKKTRK
ncbi:MAG: arylsulfatase/uncharacterized sulfatase [Porticoccus sp.]|jgi:arylsulfatase/uncharacterized sulfatase